MKKALVIGSGVAGLGVAIRLKALGYNTIVLEASAGPGGKLKQKQVGAYRFDRGPSLFTRPDLVEELLLLAGKKPSELLTYRRLDTLCHYFFSNHKRFIAPSNPEQFVDALYQALGEPPKNTLRFLKKANQINQVAGKVFLENSLHDWRTYLKPQTLWSLINIYQIDSLRTMNQANVSYFDKKETIQLFNRYATYNGSNPYQTPATLNLISTLEMNQGAFFPDQGMYQITQSLYQAAVDMGVQFQFNTPVSRIVHHNNRVEGVITQGGEKIDCDLVVSNSDSYNTYRYLLNNHPKTRSIEQIERSSSAVIFYWGIKKTFPDLDLHNILFSEDYEAEFQSIFKHKTVPSDPTVYINISSKYRQEDAPEGCENWFVMVNTPAKTDLVTEEVLDQLRNAIAKKVEQHFGIDILSLIEVEDVLTPQGIETETGSYLGALYGTASNQKLAAFLRPSNFVSDIKGVYLCGGSSHPGGGIPLCLLSAQITANLIDS